MAAVVFTVRQAIASCGVNDVALFAGQTNAQRISNDCFDDDFNSCLDKTFTEMDEDLKSYAQLTAANGRITTTPGTKRAIRAFIQWTKQQIRIAVDPTTLAFPVADTATYISNAKTHKLFCDKSKIPRDEKSKVI